MNRMKSMRYIALVDRKPFFIKIINFDKREAVIDMNRTIDMDAYPIVEITDFYGFIKAENRSDYIYEKDIIFWWDTIDGKYCPRYGEVIYAQTAGQWEAFTKTDIYLLSDINNPQIYKRSWDRRDFDGFSWQKAIGNDNLARGVI